MTRFTRFLLPTVFVALLTMSVPVQAHGWSFGFSVGWGPRYYYAPAYIYRPPVVAYAAPVCYPAPVAVAPYYYPSYSYGYPCYSRYYGWGPRAVVYGGGYRAAYYRPSTYFARSWYPGHRSYAHYNYRTAFRGGHYGGHYGGRHR
jgi:hypothetical protein